MSPECLAYVNGLLSNIINYDFGIWASDVTLPYWVGEISGIPSNDESGREEATLILTGTAKSLYELVLDIEKVRQLNDTRAILSNENGIAIFYENALVIPIEEGELKRMQINLNIKEWRVD